MDEIAQLQREVRDLRSALQGVAWELENGTDPARALAIAKAAGSDKPRSRHFVIQYGGRVQRHFTVCHTWTDLPGRHGPLMHLGVVQTRLHTVEYAYTPHMNQIRMQKNGRPYRCKDFARCIRRFYREQEDSRS